MDIETELLYASRMMVAALIGGLIGCERERHASDAGIRTYMAISIRCLCILFDIRPCGE